MIRETAPAQAGPAVAGPARRQAVEDFLYQEAALLDEWRLDEWLELLTDNARYEVPSTDVRSGKVDDSLMLIADTPAMIRARVKRLNSRKAHREFPWSRTRRLISNVRILGESATGGVTEVAVTANFAVYRVRGGGTSVYVGRYIYRLIPASESFLIGFRRAELDQETLNEHGTLSIIL